MASTLKGCVSGCREALGQGGTCHIKCEELGVNPQNLCEHWLWSHVSVTLVLLWWARRWRQESSQRPMCLQRTRVPASTRCPARTNNWACPLMPQTCTAPIHLNTRTHTHTVPRETRTCELSNAPCEPSAAANGWQHWNSGFVSLTPLWLLWDPSHRKIFVCSRWLGHQTG